ncbi:MAG: Succinate--CoA ligase (ADP-forming) subunit alpha [Firmicutes bacterium]|nr:Succinate--CoA ligase (ADP-forming) subunit alpha [Bacillota bacterium]
MNSLVKVLCNEYFDSVTLMSLTAKLRRAGGAEEVVVLMGTPMNLQLIEGLGFTADELRLATSSDCVIGVRSKDDAETLVEEVLRQLKEGNVQKAEGRSIAPATIAGACQDLAANLVIISTPGEYAAREARLALEQGLHVMMFSDNVTLEDEVRLKQMAQAKGLFMMGPDCGTAIINGKGLCFANRVRQGSIGLVAASGTGLQEVAVQIHRLGHGISQGIGVGGRDLSLAVGGMMMKQGIKALAEDPDTAVIVLISKPPAEEVQREIFALLDTVPKPCVICFIDGAAVGVDGPHRRVVHSLEGAALAAIDLVDGGRGPSAAAWGVEGDAVNQVGLAAPNQKYIRALYCGGTLCAEALGYARTVLNPTFSNVAKRQEERLPDPRESRGHSFIDLGDDVFTRGRPHPMIDPELRLERIMEEAADPETLVLLLDFVLGYGAHEDPVGISVGAIGAAQVLAQKAGRYLAVVAYVCGTELDKQGLESQVELLRRAGVLVATSNLQAVKLACAIVGEGELARD